MTVRILEGLGDVAAGFDALILDLWGVVHDGVEAYPGVRDAFEAIRAAGKRTLLLSNAPRRPDVLIEQLSRLGIPRSLYDHVLSSGEAVRMELMRREDPFFAALGPSLFHLGPERDENVFAGLPYTPVDLDHADFILNTGPWDFDDTLEDYTAILEKGIARNLPMVCANPDITVMRQGVAIICAGALARRYEEMGGRVTMRGKPDRAIYDLAVGILGCPRGRVLAVGDGLPTDIRGANGADMRGVFITQGIHAAELGITPGQAPKTDRLHEVLTQHGQWPWAALPTLRW